MIDLTALSPLQLMLALALIFLAAVGANHICHALLVGAKSMRHRQVEESEPEPAEPVVSEPAVEVHVMRQVDLLPAPPVRLEDAPLARQVHVPLPDYISTGFHWDKYKPTDPHRTGSFPEIGSEMYDDASAGPLVDPSTRKRFERSEADMPALAVAQGFTSARQRFIKDPALAEAKKLLPTAKRQKRAKVDLEAGTVVIP